ncbi:hypothetical protein AB0K60_12500 [Thermopolyspora sp. NPDC052614]|uniref:hypothetical protein n=1 Tax=Thermopolyspora sp. NPDC052614 TaxID=3155682 RepID=UPI00343A29CB
MSARQVHRPGAETGTVALIALLSAQLLQTVAISHGDLVVMASGALSLAAPALIVSLPRVSTGSGAVRSAPRDG